MKTILRVFGYVRRYPALGAAQLACALVAAAMVVVFPNVLREVIDVTIPEKRGIGELLKWTGLALAAFFARDLLNSLRIMLNNTFEQKIIFDLRSDLYERIQRLPLTWFDNRSTGDIMTRVAEDVTNMERVLIDGIEQGLVALVQVGIVAGVMLYFDPALAGAAMIPIPLLAAGAYLYTRGARDRHREVRKATSAMNSLLQDNIAGIRQIKGYTMEQDEHRAFNESSDSVRQATLKVMRAWALYNPSMSFLGNAGIVLVVGFGGAAALAGDLTVGELAMFLTLLGFFYEPIGRLHSLNQMLLAGRAAAERVFDIIDAEEEPGMAGGERIAPRSVNGHVLYRGVTFRYTDDKPTLHGVSLEAQPGQTIALVGHTGAGKSTIIDLLARLYEYQEGEITVDGRRVETLHKPDLRAVIGYVTQESFLFNGTVRDNLTIAKRDATDEEMWEALRAANADRFIEAMADGLSTKVGERGIKLSVGEKQRISIARALLKNPPILLLDEATASVDTETERLIQAALDKLMEGRTSFIIAHRLSTVRRADRIYVIRAGRVIEQGTHAELLALGGEYALLSKTAFLEEKREG